MSEPRPEDAQASRTREDIEPRPYRHGRDRHGASFGRWVWEWTKSIFIALLLFLFVRTFMIEAFQIPTASMENTLLVGDFLLVNKMVYGAEIPGTRLHLPAFDEPSRGEIIVFEPPPSAAQPPRTNYVKRIVGEPGDTLSMRGGRLHLNGAVLDEPYVKPARRFGDVPSSHFDWQRGYLVDARRRRRYRPTRDNWGPLVVPEGHFFVMGDNRANSEDSRYWGFVPEDAIKGRPMLVYYSYDRRTPASAPWLTEIRWDRILHGIR
ncbi:MAG: signal peptidase I [Gemmatimonadota bacterium]|nr:signal peptidase I [Gemmatimonadota bacterium]